MRRLLRHCRHEVYPRLTAWENCRGSTCILGMLVLLGAVVCMAEAISLLTQAS
jgi:hypothetical protein